MASKSEILRETFKAWEEPTRGVTCHVTRVSLEPPFIPWTTAVNQDVADDSRLPNIFQSINTFTKQIFAGKNTFEETTPLPPEHLEITALRIIHISFPKDSKANVLDQFIHMLTLTGRQFSFEYVITANKIALQVAIDNADQAAFATYVRTHFPDCVLELPAEDYLRDALTENKHNCISSFGLDKESVKQIATVHSGTLDYFIPLLAEAKQLEQGDTLAIQIVFKGSQRKWGDSLVRSVSTPSGQSIFFDEPMLVREATDKISAPLVFATVRVITSSNTAARSKMLCDKVNSIILKFSASNQNQFKKLVDQVPSNLTLDVVDRHTHRHGMLLNTKELQTFLHFPSPAVLTDLLSNSRKTKAAPPFTEGQRFVIGINEHNNKRKEVGISTETKVRHGLTFGSSGFGKSHLMRNMIVTDAEQGNGLCLIDPHCDLVDDVLKFWPKHRIKDTIVLDIGDIDFPFSFNLLKAHTPIEKEVLASDLISAFKKHSYSWGDGLNSIFASAISAFLESSRGGTLYELKSFLVDKSFRKSFLKTVDDPSLVYYWEKEFPMLRNTSVGSIITRLDSFLRPKTVRNIVCQTKGFPFEEILDSQKALLIKLPHGMVGLENAHLLGTLIIAKIFQAALSRQAKRERPPFYLYIDEAQHFTTSTSTFMQVLQEGRKFGLGLFLSTQSSSNFDSAINESLIANVATRICFRLGQTDAQKLSNEFVGFEPEDFKNLQRGEAIVRIDRPENSFSLRTLDIMCEKNSEQDIKQIIDQSRKEYCQPRNTIEELINESLFAQAESKDISDHKISEPIPIITVESETFHPPSPITEPCQVDDGLKNLVTRKEESHHRYLQNYFKKAGELLGFKADIEVLTPSGTGRVDVALERQGISIAIEIKKSSPAEWEIKNIRKCLEGGYSTIISCIVNPKERQHMMQLIEKHFSADEKQQIFVFTVEQVQPYLVSLSRKKKADHTVKGYKIKVDYEDTSTSNKSPDILTDILLSTPKKKSKKNL